MRICLIQTEPQCDPQNDYYNSEFAMEILRQYSADLYVLPELFTVGFRRAIENPQKYAELLHGPLVQKLQDALKSRAEATVVAGLLEKDGDALYNTAAVVQRGSLNAYRQKNPATGFGKCFRRGEFATFFLGHKEYGNQLRFGFMICSDYFMADEFFAHYREQRADGIVMIADSADRKWRREFPSLCRNFGIPAIVCNAAGDKMGASCVWDSAGSPVQIKVLGSGECHELPESPAVGITALVL